MKKYFNIYLITLVLFVLIGCADKNVKITSQTKTSASEYLRLRNNIDDNGYIQIIIDKFEYEGHEYIWFKRGVGESTSGSAVHNPNCKYCKD
jgi:hypothetical protein